MKKIYLILLFLSFFNIGCKRQISNKDQIEIQKNKVIFDSFDEIMELDKTEAINKYGNPNLNTHFNLENAFGEFRIPINDVFKNVKNKKQIVIEEITWEKNDSTWITVWYHQKHNKSIPKVYYIWKKGTEF